MRDFLLDTNIWSDWFRAAPKTVKKISALNTSNVRLGISVITWGEFVYGWHVDKKFNQKEFKRFLDSKHPHIYVIDRHVSAVYGELRAKLFNTYAPKTGRAKKRPEELIDQTTAKQLGIQENDLWITAQAINNGLTLITADKKMKRIYDVAVPGTLNYELW